MNRRQVEIFIDNLQFNKNSIKEREVQTKRVFALFGIIFPVYGIYRGRTIFTIAVFLVAVVNAFIYVWSWRKDKSLIWSASGLACICLGLTSFSFSLLLGYGWLPKEYHVPIIVLYISTAVILTISVIVHTNINIRKELYCCNGKRKITPLNELIKVGGIGGSLYFLIKGNFEANAMIVTICTFALVCLMLPTIVRLLMGDYYLRHIEKFGYKSYKVHERSPIHTRKR